MVALTELGERLSFAFDAADRTVIVLLPCREATCGLCCPP